MRRASFWRRGVTVAFGASLVAASIYFSACSDGGGAAATDATVIPASDASDPCAAACGAATQACPELDPGLCASSCTSRSIQGRDASVSRDVQGCLRAAGADCKAVGDCFRPPPAVPFSEGPYGTKPRDLAAPFVLTTTNGDWDFKREWTGEESYVFLMYAPREVVYRSGDYSEGLYKGALARDLLTKSPKSVHYFFMPLRNNSGWEAARDKWAADVPDEWASRVHFVDTPANEQQNWIGDMMRTRIKAQLPYKQYDAVGFAIDRFQRIREVGMLGQLTQDGISPKLAFLAYEPIYFDFEWNRERALLSAPSPTVVSLAKQRTVYDAFEVDVALPDQATMATFDTLEVDLSTDCDNHRDGECGAWDYLSHLWVCDPPAEVDGGAPDAGPPPWQCKTEIARWITAYWREGRWVTDISGMLPFLKKGGSTHFRWWASGQWDPRKTNYNVSLSLRFMNRGKGMRPTEAIPLWNGGSWNANYDSAHPPKQIPLPTPAKKVELYTLITGHGSASGNCAEFCNHEHRFSINGKPYIRSFPGAQKPLGCAEDTGKGVVPNQHGTWYFGRGGWCPGQDVPPWTVDVTSGVKAGQSNDLTYTTAYSGRPVDADRGNIVLSSYLIVWQ